MVYSNKLTSHLDIAFLGFLYHNIFESGSVFMFEDLMNCVCCIFCSTFNNSNNFTLPDTALCWENVGVTRIGAYRIFLVSWLLEGHEFGNVWGGSY